MFPREDYLYGTAYKVGFVVGAIQILLSGFILRGYLRAAQKILPVYKELNLGDGSGFKWGYNSILILFVVGVVTLLLAFLLKRSKPERRGRYYACLAPLLFLGIVAALLCIYTFQRLVISPVIRLPD